MASNKGMTLIELLVVVAIVGILAAIAVPVYTNYLLRARRADAKTGLEQLRASQEMFRAERGRYANDGDDGNGLLTLQTSWGVPGNPVGAYNILFIVDNQNSFTAQAAPFTSSQLPDGSLFINQNATRWDCPDNNPCLSTGLNTYPAGKWAK
jgi:type IV pilus assembly protein PilE